MTAWFSLFKKEFRNGLPAILISVLGIVILLVLDLFFSWRSGHIKDVFMITSLILIFPHAFYLLFYMMMSLQKEKKKLHLWLANPMPGYGLILAKLINGVLAMSITLFICCVIFLITYVSSPQNPLLSHVLNWTIITKLGFISLLHIYLFALDFAIWFIFFWVFYRMLLRRIGILASIIFTMVTFGVLSYIFAKFETTGLYNGLSHWGRLSLPSLENGFEFSTKNGFQALSHAHAYFGTYLFEAIIAMILFFVASWMLDRKVEV